MIALVDVLAKKRSSESRTEGPRREEMPRGGAVGPEPELSQGQGLSRQESRAPDSQNLRNGGKERRHHLV